MARHKNASFAGVAVADADVGRPTFERAIADAVGDTALVFDKATGSNGETGVITHNGGTGTGATLNVPIINQWVGRSFYLTSPDTAGKSGGVGETWVWAAPFHLAAGETTLIVEVSALLPVPVPFYAKVCTVANVEVQRRALAVVDDPHEKDTLVVCRFTGLTAGWNLLFLVLDTTDADDAAVGKLNYVRARARKAIGRPLYEQGPASAPVRDAASPFGVTTPAAAEGVAHTDFEATLFANLEPIDGYTLARLNRNLNGLAEFITRWPAGGNSAYTHVDHDGGGSYDSMNPARSRFEAHTRALYANEGELDFPICSMGFGAFIDGGYFAVDLAEPPTIGMLDHYAPWPRTTAEQTIRSLYMPVPDFQSGSSRLKCRVLFGSTNAGTADPTQWTIKCKTTTGNATAAPVDTDGNQTLWMASIDAVPFTGDADELVEIRMSRAGAKPAGTNGIGEICVLGAALAFDP